MSCVPCFVLGFPDNLSPRRTKPKMRQAAGIARRQVPLVSGMLVRGYMHVGFSCAHAPTSFYVLWRAINRTAGRFNFGSGTGRVSGRASSGGSIILKFSGICGSAVAVATYSNVCLECDGLSTPLTRRTCGASFATSPLRYCLGCVNVHLLESRSNHITEIRHQPTPPRYRQDLTLIMMTIQMLFSGKGDSDVVQ